MVSPINTNPELLFFFVSLVEDVVVDLLVPVDDIAVGMSPTDTLVIAPDEDNIPPPPSTVEATAKLALGADGCGIISSAIGGGAGKLGGGSAPGGKFAKLGGKPPGGKGGATPGGKGATPGGGGGGGGIGAIICTFDGSSVKQSSVMA